MTHRDDLDRSDADDRRVRVEILGPRSVAVRDPELFESSDGAPCRAFLRRVFGLECIARVDLSPGSREARLHVREGGPALAEVLRQLAGELRDEARGDGREGLGAPHPPGRSTARPEAAPPSRVAAAPDVVRDAGGLRPRDRALLAVLLGVFVYLVTPSWITQESRALLAWNAGALLVLAMVGTMMLRSDAQRTSERSQAVEPSYLPLLVVVVLTASFGLAGAAAMLDEIQRMSPLESRVHLGLSVLTAVTAWVIVHLYFALRYARIYYDRARGDGRRPFAGGLAFPESERVDYWDFIYYSFTIAMCFQTSDVPVESRPMRRLTIVHSVVSFFFVIAILGLVVNVASTLV